MGAGLLSLAAGLLYTLARNEVDNHLTADDIQTIHAALGKAVPPGAAEASEPLQAQIARIRRVVAKVYEVAPALKAIPEGHPREPRDVVNNGGGVCYDRSRFIEKALRAAGFETRHAALYWQRAHQNALQVLMTRDTRSHAISEVRTMAGWMLIDPVTQWVATDAQGMPVSALQIAHSHRSGPAIQWPAGTSAPEFYSENFLVVYGLYSRHGTFFPPFNGIPDVNYSELLFNLSDRG